MKILSKKLLMSIVAVTLVVAALGTSTFAWFTLSNRASLGQFSAEVSSGEGIEVNLNGQANWYTDIPTDIMQTYINSSAVPFTKFKDVTSSDGVNFTNLDGTTALKPSYVEFQINFRSAQKDMVVYWSGITLNGALLAGGVAKPWVADQTFKGADGVAVEAKTSMTVDPSNAIRVSVAALGATETTNVFEKPTNTGTTTSINGGNTALGNEFKTDGAVSYYNSKNETDLDSSDFSVPLAVTQINDTVNKLKVVSLSLNSTTGFYEGSAMVRVWIEGWDPDAYNAILSGKVTVALAFIGVVETTPQP